MCVNYVQMYIVCTYISAIFKYSINLAMSAPLCVRTKGRQWIKLIG